MTNGTDVSAVPFLRAAARVRLFCSVSAVPFLRAAARQAGSESASMAGGHGRN